MKRVLVVERDSLHRDLIREWLEEGGAQAVYADGTARAVADIDAVLVDVSCQQQAHATLDIVAPRLPARGAGARSPGASPPATWRMMPWRPASE